MTAETDIAAIADGGNNSPADVRTALTSSLTPFWVRDLYQVDSPNTDDDYFSDETKTGWTETTASGSATWTESRGVMSVLFANQSSADMAVALKSITSASAPLTIETAIRLYGKEADFIMAGLLFADGTTTAANVVAAPIYRSSAVTELRHPSTETWSGTITNLGTGTDTPIQVYCDSPMIFVRLKWVSANTWNFEYSPDGVSWYDQGNTNDTISMTPTHYGLWVSTYGGTGTGIATFEYFKVT